MARRKKTYSAEQKRVAVDCVLGKGQQMSIVARRMNIPYGTLWTWVDTERPHMSTVLKLRPGVVSKVKKNRMLDPRTMKPEESVAQRAMAALREEQARVIERINRLVMRRSAIAGALHALKTTEEEAD